MNEFFNGFAEADSVAIRVIALIGLIAIFSNGFMAFLTRGNRESHLTKNREKIKWRDR